MRRGEAILALSLLGAVGLARRDHQAWQLRRVPASSVLLLWRGEAARASRSGRSSTGGRVWRSSEVQVGVELAAESFDGAGFLQQHKLRLDLHLEAARCLEQAQQVRPKLRCP